MSKSAVSRTLRLLVLLCPACVPGSHTQRPVYAALGAGLAPELVSPAVSPAGPLRLVHFSPQGKEVAPGAVTILFDRPIRALSADPAPPQDFALEPALPGRWTWVGTHAVAFEPSAHEFPNATAFKVTLPERLQGIDGSKLESTRVFEFATRRPRVSIDECNRGPLVPTRNLRLTVNQAISQAEIERVLRVETHPRDSQAERDALEDEALAATGSAQSAAAGSANAPEGTANWPIRIRQGKPSRDEGSQFTIVPRTPWPFDSDIRVVVAPGLTSSEGPLSTQEEFQQSCSTHDLPLAELQCSRRPNELPCQGPDVSLVFKNSPTDKDLASRVLIEPRAKVKLTPNHDLEIVSLRPSTHYRITLPGGIHGKWGGVTRKAQVIEFDMSAPSRDPKALHNIFYEGQLEPDLLKPLHVWASNTQEFHVGVLALNPTDLMAYRAKSDKWGELTTNLLKSTWTAFKNSKGPNLPYEADIDLQRWLDPVTHTGSLLLGVTPNKDEPLRNSENEGPSARILRISDLAMTTKLWRDGAGVWVTSLEKATPVSDVDVTLYKDGTPVLPVGRTGSDGYLSVPSEALQGYWAKAEDNRETRQGYGGFHNLGGFSILVQRGKDWNLQALDGYRESISWSVPRLETRVPEIFLFLDRGVYRPGETVYVKGYVHQQTPGLSHVLPGRAVTLALDSYPSRPPEAHLASQKSVTNDWGAFDSKFVLPKHLPESPIVLSAKVGEQFGWVTVPISAYRPVEFEAHARGPEAVVAGQAASFEVEGKYLLGDPMRGAIVDIVANYQDTYFTPPNTVGYDFAASILDVYAGYSSEKTPDSSRSLHLDENGRGLVQVETKHRLLGPQRLTVTAKIFDVARRGLQATASAIVHPANLYVGLRQASRSKAGQPLVVEGIAVDWSGRRIPAKPIRVSLMRVIQDDEAETEDPDTSTGRYHLKTVASCTMLSSTTNSRCSVMPLKPGDYVVLGASKDEAGRETRTAIPVFVSGSSRSEAAVDRYYGNGNYNEYRPVLKLDRENYHVGEEAHLTVTSPFSQGWALVTLQRDGIYWWQAKAIGSSGEFNVPITTKMGKNAALDVLVYRRPGRSDPFLKTGGGRYPIHAHSWIRLQLADDERRLRVQVRPSSTQASPNDKFECSFQVTDRLNRPRPSELTVWAVDDGVLQLTDYQLPDPLKRFESVRPSETSTLDSRTSLAWFIDPKSNLGGISLGSLGHGGGEGSGSRPETKAVRHDGPPTILFQPRLVTDEQGHAKLTIQLPERLSRFRVMALATTKYGEFGAGQAFVASHLPLSARPMMPRFVRVGDEFEAGVIVSADPAVHATGRVRAHATGLKAITAITRSVTLDAGHAVAVPFRWRAEKTGTAHFQFDLSVGEQRDAVAFDVPVKEVKRFDTVALYGETSSTTGERVGPLPSTSGHDAELQVELANTPLVGLTTAFEQLAYYEHQCSEQLASHLLAIGALRRLGRDVGFSYEKETLETASQLIEALGKRQSYNGGFRYWESDLPIDSWLSAYVTWVLSVTAKAGIEVNSAVLKPALEYVASSLRSDSIREPQTHYAHTLALDVAAEFAPSPEVFQAIAGLAAETGAQPVFAQAWLLHALLVSKDKVPNSSKLAKGLEQSILTSIQLSGDRAYLGAESSEFANVLDSRDRTVALVLRALLAYDRNHPMAPALLRGLLASRKNMVWSSTQASAWALSAIADYQVSKRWARTRSEERVWLDDAIIASTQLSPTQTRFKTTARLAGSKGTSALVFDHRGSGSLFYTAKLTFERPASAAREVAQGFEITNSIAPLTYFEAPNALKPVALTPSIEAGVTLLGEVTLYSPVPRSQVVVQVPLPAGLEPIDPSHDRALGIESRGFGQRPQFYGAGVNTYARVYDDRINFYIEKLDAGTVQLMYIAQANTLGTFVVPAAHVTEMYRPEFYARTAASQLTITEKMVAPSLSSNLSNQQASPH